MNPFHLEQLHYDRTTDPHLKSFFKRYSNKKGHKIKLSAVPRLSLLSWERDKVGGVERGHWQNEIPYSPVRFDEHCQRSPRPRRKRQQRRARTAQGGPLTDPGLNKLDSIQCDIAVALARNHTQLPSLCGGGLGLHRPLGRTATTAGHMESCAWEEITPRMPLEIVGPVLAHNVSVSPPVSPVLHTQPSPGLVRGRRKLHRGGPVSKSKPWGHDYMLDMLNNHWKA